MYKQCYVYEGNAINCFKCDIINFSLENVHECIILYTNLEMHNLEKDSPLSFFLICKWNINVPTLLWSTKTIIRKLLQYDKIRTLNSLNNLNAEKKKKVFDFIVCTEWFPNFFLTYSTATYKMWVKIAWKQIMSYHVFFSRIILIWNCIKCRIVLNYFYRLLFKCNYSILQSKIYK